MTTLEQTIEVVAFSAGLPISEVGPDDDFWADLNLDSLDIVTLIMELEEAFGIAIPDALLNDPSLATPRAAALWIQRTLDRQAQIGEQ